MTVTLPTGAKLPSSVRIVRKDFVFLEDTSTGVIIPAVLNGDDESSSLGDAEIQAYMNQLGYQKAGVDRFELAKTLAKTVPLPSVN